MTSLYVASGEFGCEVYLQGFIVEKPEYTNKLGKRQRVITYRKVIVITQTDP